MNDHESHTEGQTMKQRKKRSTVTIPCEQCGTVFRQASSVYAKRKRNYCSLACSKQARQERNKAVCEQCGALFERNPHARARVNNTFCSLKCYRSFRRTPPDHGTVSSYGTYKCRCDLCRKAMADYMRQYRKNKPEYTAWFNMMQSCENPRSNSYHLFGGRGIAVCDRWRSFADFLSDVGPRVSSGYYLGRIDTDGNYTPDNVAWIKGHSARRRRQSSSNQVRSAL